MSNGDPMSRSLPAVAPDALGRSPSAPDTLGRRTAWGFIWALTGTLGGKLLGLLTLVVLARILSPGEYGLFALALVYITYLDTVSDLGTGMALVYWPDRTRDAAQATFVVNLAMGVALTGATLALAPVVADFFRTPEAAPVLRALAWTFLLKSLGNTHDALCKKELRFKARLLPELGLTGFKALVAILLASLGLGVWSLVWGQLAGVALSTVLLWSIVPWRPEWRWPGDMFRPLFSYAGGIVAVNVLAAVVHHVDSVIVGRVLGAAALGYYQIAYRLPEIAVSVLVWQVGRVLFPAYARLRASGGELRQPYLLTVRYMGLFAGPAAIGIFLLAEPMILVLFGEKWLPAAPILGVLGLYAGIRALGSHTGEVLKASGRPGLLAMLGVVKAIALVPALLFASRWGVLAVAMTLLAVSVGTVLLNFVVSARIAGVSLGAVLNGLREGALATLVVAAVILAFRSLAPASAGPLHLASAMVLALLSCGLIVWLRAPELYRQAWANLAPAQVQTTPPASAESNASTPALEVG